MTMSTRTALIRLKGHLSAQGRPLTALTTATRRLHDSIDRMIDATVTDLGTAPSRGITKAHKRNGSGASSTRRRPKKPSSAAGPAATDRKGTVAKPPPDRAAALERHW